VDIGSLGGVSKKVYLFIKVFRICAVHTLEDNKLRINFEVIVLQVGLDLSQNLKVIIVKKRMSPSLARYLSTNPKMETT
jgi:hypothetical protein